MVSEDWASLPAAVRRAIESRTGAVAATVSPDNGRNSDFLATLQTSQGPCFVKGVLTGTRRARAQQTEARVGARPNSAAPRLLWEVTADGWHVLGFEALSGHHPSLAPGSPDLPMVAETVAAMARELSPSPVELEKSTDQWAWSAPWRRLSKSDRELDSWDKAHLPELLEWERRGIEAVNGNSLVHGDMHPLNILVSDRARVVDWAWSSVGAPWLDPAALVLRLIADGHTPEQAEEWAKAIAAYRDTPAEAVTAFAVLVFGMWAYRGVFPGLTDVARQYVRHRLGA
ncbi:phosphotransferase family protein [Amycolatopsis panacis]|nr:phosphotransferase [Amycolatopsis panacis]